MPYQGTSGNCACPDCLVETCDDEPKGGTINTSITNASAIVSDTLKRFTPVFLARYSGVLPDVEGQRAEAMKTQKTMLKGFLVGLVGVFL